METVLIGIGYSIISGVIIYLLAGRNDHEKRIQKIEDIQGSKLDNLQVEFTKFEGKLDKLSENVANLSSNIHKSKNEENALNATMTAILKHLENQAPK